MSKLRQIIATADVIISEVMSGANRDTLKASTCYLRRLLDEGRHLIDDGKQAWQYAFTALDFARNLNIINQAIGGETMPAVYVTFEGTEEEVNLQLAEYEKSYPPGGYGTTVVHKGDGFVRVRRWSTCD